MRDPSAYPEGNSAPANRLWGLEGIQVCHLVLLTRHTCTSLTRRYPQAISRSSRFALRLSDQIIPLIPSRYMEAA